MTETLTEMGTVLVTGGAGFIGTAIAQRFSTSARKWIVLDNLHPQVHENRVRPVELPANVELVIGDVANAADWDALLLNEAPDTIVHLAAETGTAQSLYEATRHARVNVSGTTEMLDALGRAQHVPRHFILSSSRAVYGEGRWVDSNGRVWSPGRRSHAQLEQSMWDFPGSHGLPSSALETPPAPTSIYGATKLSQEHILNSWAAAHDTAVSILRLQNVYGPGQSLTNSYTGIVSLFSQLARAGKSIPLYEDGDIVRDFVLIDDVAGAFGAVLQRGPSGLSGPWDIGTGTPMTIGALAHIISEYHAAPSPHITGAFRDGDVRFAACSIERSRNELDWAPRYSLQDGVARLQEWIATKRPEPASE